MTEPSESEHGLWRLCRHCGGVIAPCPIVHSARPLCQGWAHVVGAGPVEDRPHVCDGTLTVQAEPEKSPD